MPALEMSSIPEQQASQLPGLPQALCSEEGKAQGVNCDFPVLMNYWIANDHYSHYNILCIPLKKIRVQ
jgi:hypothetical protein